MSQQIINISTPDDGLGDVLRNGFDKTNQNFTELYNGKVDKVTGKGLSKNDFTDADKAKLDGIEAGAEVNVQSDWGETDPLSDSFIQNKPPSLYSAFGYFHVSDLATQTTPLAFVASTPLKLTNDNAGAFTSEDNAPYGVPKIWNASTNSLDFTHLSVGDAVLVRTDLLISTTSVNQNLRLYIKFGVGTASEYDLLIDSWNEKSVVTFEEFIKDVSFSIDNEDWRDAPADIYILSDDDGSVKVNGWYTPIIRKSVNLVEIIGGENKVDKDTTSGVERVYTINSDGSQGTKPTSDFKDVLEFANFASFPVTGESEKIYIALDTNSTYRWSGSVYVQIGGSKRTFSIRIPISQNIAASTSWYSRLTTNQNIFNGIFTAAASLDPSTDFATHAIQTPCDILPFDCKVKSVQMRGHSNSGSANIRVAILKSGLAGTSSTTVVSPKIIADKTFIMSAGGSSSYYADWSNSEMNLTETCLKGSEIRMLIFNNNVTSNLYTSVCLIEFEEL